MANADVRRFQGVTYRRYPNSERPADRRYFKSSTGKSLHRAIWEHYRGPIPPGCHIHHRDGDVLNNRVGNLECIDGREHIRSHAREPARVAMARKNIRIAVQHAKKWHASPEGRAWHAEHARSIKQEKVERECIRCGGKFTATKRGNVCSAKCHAALRRASGVDDESRACNWCRKVFQANRYSKQWLCSRSCLARQTNALRRKRV